MTITGFTIGQNYIISGSTRTITRFADGSIAYADHAVQPGQAERAAEIGYPSAEAMNREHNLTHSLLAHWLGLDYSPTLHAVANGQRSAIWQAEESAVLAIQQFARAAGVDLVKLARECVT
jgi:hypothetical protein